MKRRFGNQKGMAAVEFALLAPVLAVLLLGIAEFGMAFYKQQIITNAAREAARIGIVASDPPATTGEISSRALTYLTNSGLNAGDATVLVSGAGGGSGASLNVEVQYPANLSVVSALVARTATSAGSGGIPGQLNLTARVVMEHE